MSRRTALVECLPGYRLSNLDGERLVDVAVHLVDEEEHGDIHLQMQFLLPVGDAVEPLGVSAAKIYRHHVAVVFDAFRYERLLPRQVMDDTVLLPRVQSCREHEHVVVALESGLHHSWKVAALPSRLVDAYRYRPQAGEVEQQVVDEVAEASVVVLADDGSEGHAVLTAQGMVADEGVQLSVVLVGEIIAPFDVDRHVEVSYAGLQPFRSREVAALPKESVHLVLVDDALEPPDGKGRHETSLLAHLTLEDFLYVYCFLYMLTHDKCYAFSLQKYRIVLRNRYFSLIISAKNIL